MAVSILEPWHLILLVVLILPVVLLLALVAGVAAIIRSSRERETDTALDILKERYARGEITKDDFKRIKKDLI